MSSTPQQSIGGGSKPTGPLQQGRSEDKNSIRPQIPSGRTWLWLVAVLAANYLMVKLLFPAPQGAITVPYTFFKLKRACPAHGDALGDERAARVSATRATGKSLPQQWYSIWGIGVV